MINADISWLVYDETKRGVCSGVVLSCGGLLADLFDQELGAERLGPLDGEAECARPHQLGQAAERARHAEHYRVVAHLLQTVILETNILILTEIWNIYWS